MKPSASLDEWREYFRRGGDSDIFQIIDHAIMVAAADSPNQFKSRRDRIAELLFSCRVCRCTGCDHVELSVPGDDEVDGGSKENSSRGDNNNQIVSNYSFDEEAEALSAAIEEFSIVSKEVVRIKEMLLNRDDEPHSVILESLRKLKLMSLNVDILKSTEIGKAVNGLRKHASDHIRQLAKTLIAEWKELVDRWVNTTKDLAGAGGTPESANPSVVDQEEAFPSLPYDVDIFTPEANGFEILNGDFFDSLHFDDPCNSEEYNTSREHERRKTQKRTQMRIQEDAPFRSIKPSSTSADGTRRPLKHEMVSLHKSQMKPLATEHKRKAPGPQQQKLKGLDADAKFEFAKRKLQERYQHHENAKKQRTIQVLETIPKQASATAQKPQLKRPGKNNRSWSNGRR
ncbi:putative mediator of RNA polymerase II transcription subunit 26b [Raphanus sativus]|uniref:Probable mediator of RNA polymerase II transcription subunit 26b isoform X3 n=1 Tax=Raphanus sativus TaxID=3726 RepID=A0A6J0LAN6_RAPSA|nr:probable mediator of RNA polymerase II transcription subunit 26b isoform X3 [Raphanus sativus]KAJ4911650.1 putative mediator of RNA polymerase II transcription subunit 26b [Raphanus sativus]